MKTFAAWTRPYWCWYSNTRGQFVCLCTWYCYSKLLILYLNIDNVIRGTLHEVLANVRNLADSDFQSRMLSDFRDKVAIADPLVTEAQDRATSSSEQASRPITNTTPAKATNNSTGAASSSKATIPNSDKIFKNFRELLWFWREYYLRRGRDRLSIEFSSHIPFSYWLLVVGSYICYFEYHTIHQPNKW